MSSQVEMPSRSKRRDDDDDEEESSSLLLNQQKHDTPSSSPRSTTNGNGKLHQSPSSSSASSVWRDLRICNTAWNRLSSPTRSILLIVMAVVLIVGTYEFGLDEGVREQEHVNNNNSMEGSHLSVFGGDDKTIMRGADDTDNDNSETSTTKIDKQPNPYSIGNTAKTTTGSGNKDNVKPPTPQPTEIQSTLETFNRDALNAARSRSMALLYELKEYYGGEDQAKNMLVDSWQTGWMLEEDEYKCYDNDGEHEGEDDDDDDSVSVVEDSDGVEGQDENELRHLGKRSEQKKKRKKKHIGKKHDDDDDDSNTDDDNDDADDDNTNDDDDDNAQDQGDAKKKEKNKNKKPKKKGAKEGKVLINPNTMSQTELTNHHHRRRQRTHKLVSTMARAILNPHQRIFKIGTIGSSVAAGKCFCSRLPIVYCRYILWKSILLFSCSFG